MLSEFINKKIVREENGRYYLDQTNIDLSSLGSDLGFAQLFDKVIGEVSRNYRKKLNSKEELFFYSAFSIRRDRMPEMKKRFRELLLEFIDSEQTDDGDAVVKTIFALYL